MIRLLHFQQSFYAVAVGFVLSTVLALFTITYTATSASARTTTIQSDIILVEFYTSQGCNECENETKIMNELAKDPRMLPVALHVNHMDYLGYPDPFAQESFNKRQKGYIRASGQRMVYLPHIVVNGSDNIIGHKPMQLMKKINAQKQKPKAIKINLKCNGDRLHIDLVPLQDTLPKSLSLQVMRYEPQKAILIKNLKTGQNRKSILRNVVVDWDIIAEWDGVSRDRLTIEVKDDKKPIVVMLQEPNYGTIVAATQILFHE